ncbi:MAG: FecR domain-containing protein, partial [Verrucomicrobia bacterium]|nr:FecR domain-containing protein [Verrucomicrobiota bacterium]
DGKKEKILVGQVLALNDKIATGKSGRNLVGMAPGVVLSVEPESVVSLEKMSAEIKNGELLNRAAIVNTESGLVVMNIAPWNKEKTDVRVKTTEGESVAQGTVFAVNFSGGKMVTTVTRGSVGSTDASGKSVSISMGQQASPGGTPASTPANSPAAAAAGNAVAASVNALVANVAASIAAAIPSSAAEVAAIAAKAVPAAAEQIAGAVAAKAPESAIAIAQAVSKVAPESASKVAAAVIAATPGLDAKSISAITTASSQGAADAPSVDTASGTEGGNAGGVGAGSGGIGQAATSTQLQQLQADQNAKATADAAKAAADAVKAAAAEVQRLKDALAAANAADKQRLRDELNKATIALETARSNNEKAQLDLAAAQAKQTAAATASSNAANILQTVTPDNAASLASSLVVEAGEFADLKQDAQELAARNLVTAQKTEAEKLAQADAAAAAAQVAADLATKIALSKSQAELNAAAAAAVQAAKDLADAANTKSVNATALAGSTKTAATDFLSANSGISTEANLYMDSSPSFDGKIVVPASRSIKSIFTPEQLSGANGTKLKEFIAKWDAYTEAEMKKYAAAAEYNKLDTAYRAVDALKTTLQNSSFENAKNTANTKLLEIQTEANVAAKEAQDAEDARLGLAKLEAAAQAAREVAVAAKAAAAKLAADILADVTKAAELAAALNLKLSTEAGVAQGALTGLDDAAAAAKAAADKAIADAEEAARQVPVSQGGTKPIQATDTASNLI